MISDVVIDLSHYDTVTPDWAQVYASGVRAVILKATQLDRSNGVPFTDPTFVERSQNAKGAGLLVGAYCFFTAAPVDQQMALFLKVALPETEFLVLDFEAYPQSQPTLIGVRAAIGIIRAKLPGRSPVIYTGRYIAPTVDPVLGSCALWLAEWGTNPVPGPSWSAWNLWQYTSVVGSVQVPGIGHCQRSRFNGSLAQLQAWWMNPTLQIPSQSVARHHRRRVRRRTWFGGRKRMALAVAAMAAAGMIAAFIAMMQDGDTTQVSYDAGKTAEGHLSLSPPLVVPSPLIPYGVSVCVKDDLRRGIRAAPCDPVGSVR